MMAGKRQPVRYTRQQVHPTKSRWLSLPGIGIFIAIFTAFALWVDKIGVSFAALESVLHQCIRSIWGEG